MVLTEFRAIDKDRKDNADAQTAFFQSQRLGFRSITDQASKDFSVTTSGLQTAIGALKETLQQTAPRSEIGFQGVAFEERFPDGGNFPDGSTTYHLDFKFSNSGNASAYITRRLARIYVGKPDDLNDQKRLVQRFLTEWVRISHAKNPALQHPNSEPSYWTESRVFTNEEEQEITEGATIYTLVRIEYRDRTGIWLVDECKHMQITGGHLYLRVAHPCFIFNEPRQKAN